MQQLFHIPSDMTRLIAIIQLGCLPPCSGLHHSIGMQYSVAAGKCTFCWQHCACWWVRPPHTAWGAPCATSRPAPSLWSWALMWTPASQTLSPPGSSSSHFGEVPAVCEPSTPPCPYCKYRHLTHWSTTCMPILGRGTDPLCSVVLERSTGAAYARLGGILVCPLLYDQIGSAVGLTGQS